MFEKYKYAIILTLIFLITSTIIFYKNKSEKLSLELENIHQNYSQALDKIKQQERSIAEYKESIKRQDDKLKIINDKSISYEKELNSLKSEVKSFNIKEEIKKDPAKVKIFINEKINKQFNDINELTKWKL